VFLKTMLDIFVVVSTIVRIERASSMKTYEFDIVLKDAAALTDDHADALFAAGCDDGTPVSSNGQTWIHFDREAASLEEAIRSAVSQVQSVGFCVSRVELDAKSAVGLGA
jgi:hypothetical protein